MQQSHNSKFNLKNVFKIKCLILLLNLLTFALFYEHKTLNKFVNNIFNLPTEEKFIAHKMIIDVQFEAINEKICREYFVKPKKSIFFLLFIIGKVIGHDIYVTVQLKCFEILIQMS